MPVKDLTCLMTGKEASSDAFGTAATLSAKWPGVSECTMTPIVESETLPELNASLAPGYNSVIKRKSGTVGVTGAASYGEIIFGLEGLFGTVVPGSVDTDGCYLRQYSAPLGDAVTPVRYTMLYGASDACYQLSGCTLTKFDLKGESGGIVEYTWEFGGKTMSAGTWNSDIADSDRALSVITGCHTSLTIDPGSDAVGTTAVSTTGFSFELSVDPKRSMKYHLGACTPDSSFDNKWEGTLKLVLEVNTTSKAYMDALIAPTTNVQKNVRIKMDSSPQYLYVDFGGVVNEPPVVFSDQDGISTIELTLVGQYTSGMTNWLKVDSHATVAALP